jgi:hypothetical protein
LLILASLRSAAADPEPAWPLPSGELPPTVLQPPPEPSGFHASLLGGLMYERPFELSFIGGFAELRLGGELAGIELTGRLRLTGGRTLGGLSFEQVLPGFGVLVKAGSHLRFGGALNFGPLLVQRYSRPETLGSLSVGIYGEALVDLVHTGERGGLFLSARAGLEIVGESYGPHGSSNYSAVVGPALLGGAGYRF